MAKEDDMLNKLGLIMLELKSCYSCFDSGNSKKQTNALKDLFKAYNNLVNAKYEVLRK